MDKDEVLRITCAADARDYIEVEKAEYRGGAWIQTREGKFRSMVRIDREGIRDIIAYLVELLEDDE